MFGLLGTLATSIIGGMFQSNAQKSAASQASAADYAASQAAIAEQRRQFNALLQRSQPYMRAGQIGMNGMLNLAGLNGDKAQQQAVNGIQNGAGFQAQVQHGEQGILANAAATGGLRGGNVQAALGQFRPAMLQQAIDQQYARLGGLTNMGQNTAVNAGNMGMGMANQIGGQLTAGGNAMAGNALAQGQASANMWGNIAGAAGSFFGGLPQGATWGSVFGGNREVQL
jgi:hypothetical protein